MQHGRVPPELPSHISELMIINGVDLPATFPESLDLTR